jgi:hypothetical protein
MEKAIKSGLDAYLLRCGAIAGPLFILAALIQDYTRPGYDPRLQLLSLLALGDWGWVQVANFVICGVLNLGYAFGLRRVLREQTGGTWSPILIGAYGLGLVIVGVCRTDPSGGFPLGEAAPSGPTWHGAVHALGGLFIFITLTASLAVFARMFADRRERGWTLYSAATALSLPVLFFSSFSSSTLTARCLRLATLLGWMAASAIAMKLSFLALSPRNVA